MFIKNKICGQRVMRHSIQVALMPISYRNDNHNKKKCFVCNVYNN